VATKEIEYSENHRDFITEVMDQGLCVNKKRAETGSSRYAGTTIMELGSNAAVAEEGEKKSNIIEGDTEVIIGTFSCTTSRGGHISHARGGKTIMLRGMERPGGSK